MHLPDDLQLNEKTWNHDGIQKKDQGQFLKVIIEPIIYKFFKDFTNSRKKD